jgi:hypothetical protein
MTPPRSLDSSDEGGGVGLDPTQPLSQHWLAVSRLDLLRP